MSAEQVVRDFLNIYDTQGIDASLVYLADNLTWQQPGSPWSDRNSFIQVGRVVLVGSPDFKWNIQSVTAKGNEVTVEMRWTGTNTGPIHLGVFIPGAPTVPPTGKKVAVPDRFVFNVDGEQITKIQIVSPANGGLVGFMQQLGIPMPQQ